MGAILILLLVSIPSVLSRTGVLKSNAQTNTCLPGNGGQSNYCYLGSAGNWGMLPNSLSTVTVDYRVSQTFNAISSTQTHTPDGCPQGTIESFGIQLNWFQGGSPGQYPWVQEAALIDDQPPYTGSCFDVEYWVSPGGPPYCDSFGFAGSTYSPEFYTADSNNKIVFQVQGSNGLVTGFWLSVYNPIDIWEIKPGQGGVGCEGPLPTGTISWSKSSSAQFVFVGNAAGGYGYFYTTGCQCNLAWSTIASTYYEDLTAPTYRPNSAYGFLTDQTGEQSNMIYGNLYSSTSPLGNVVNSQSIDCILPYLQGNVVVGTAFC